MPAQTQIRARQPGLTLRAGWVLDARDSIPPVEPPTILIVDRLEPSRNLLKGMLDPERYRIIETPRSRDALRVLERERVDLVVLDFLAPESGGPDLCRRIKSDRSTRLIPVLMLADTSGVEPEIESLDSGADEVLTRPLHPALVRARVGLMLRHKALIDSLEDTEAILFALAEAVEQRDRGARHHCERLATIGVALGRVLGLPRPDLEALHRGGYLHDIGKISVPDAILFKPGPLTPEEWAVMREHTVKGEQICIGVRTLSSVTPIIRSHHERWDGSGYPDGLRGEEIPLLARILQVADIYDALTSARRYKSPMSASQAMGVLAEETRRGWRDPEIVRVFGSIWQETVGEQIPQIGSAPAAICTR